MKIPIPLSIAATLLALILHICPSAIQAQVAEGQEMITLPGDGRVHEITLNTQVATTVTFPAPITMVTGYGMVLNVQAATELIESEKQAAALAKEIAIKPVTIVHYAQASPDTLAMRAVRPGTPCFVTVRCDTTVFLFKVIAGEMANLAVVMQDPAASVTNPVVEVKPQEVAKTRIAFSGAELVGILSKARQREFLQTVNPGLYTGWRERRGIALTSRLGDLETTITEVQQWPQKDAIVLRARVQNNGARDLRFKPVDTKVRVGDRSYAVQLADGTGLAPAGKGTLLDVVLQGNSIGGREHLSIENDFSLEIAEDHTPPPPNDLLPTPQPLVPTVEYKQASAGDPPPTVIYEGRNVILPDDPRDRSAPLPNLYPGSK